MTRSEEETEKALKKLREPFPENLVSRLPKGGTYLSYVGHAALTARLLEADPFWSWDPMALTEQGLPRFDESGGLWIRLTICGVTRIGYGHAKGKTGPGQEPGTREKEVIGDALRNAGMRFGAALDLWHKGDLHAHEEEQKEELRVTAKVGVTMPSATPEEWAVWLLAGFEEAKSLEDIEKANALIQKEWGRIRDVRGIKESVVAMRRNAKLRLCEPKGEEDLVEDPKP